MSRDPFEAERERMVVEHLESRGIHDARVLAAIRRVPRHAFMPPEYENEAYADRPMPLEEGQTISQPYIVALMTQMLGLEPGHRVLEIGTGSGYQAAVLAEIVKEVFTVEVRAGLFDRARRQCAAAGYTNIRFRLGDGWDGWPENAPFDRVVVTACAPEVPPKLIEQLSPRGVMVLPISGGNDDQTLCRVTHRPGFGVDIEHGVPVRFVPMTSN